MRKHTHKFAAALALVSVVAYGAKKKPIIIYAQTLPVTKTFGWDIPPDACAGALLTCPVIDCTPSLDGTALPVVTAPANSTPVTFTTAGNHTLGVFCRNLYGNGGTTTATVTVKVPDAPKNPRIG